MKKSLQIRSHKLQKNKSSKKTKSFKKKLRQKIRKKLTQCLGWKKVISDSVAGMICSLLSYGKVLQKDLIRENQKDNKSESKIRGIQRFLKGFYFDYIAFSTMITTMLGLNNKMTILIDRTNWDYGKKHINIFVAAALWSHPSLNQKSAIPVVWEVFDKKGCSNTQERINLIDQLIKVIGTGNITEILGDREFIGDDWIAFLHANLIPFILRIKKNMYIEIDGKSVKAEDLVASVAYKQKLNFNAKLNGIPVQLEATRSIE